MVAWDDKQYLMFSEERTRPARELLSRVPVEKPHRVFDLGCGPGNSTELLTDRWPFAEVTGVDNSPEMLARARRDLPTANFVAADLADYRPQEADVLFANAVFQWLPDHARLMPALFQTLRPEGAIALQMPCSFDEPSHRIMRELSGSAAGTRRTNPVESASFYYDLFAPGAQLVDVWQTRYEHVMPSAEAIVDWVKGTGLRPYLEALGEARRADFLRDYTSAIAEAYPARADGKRLLSFPRLFVVAVR